MSLFKKLIEIQSELKVPKNQFNDFGGYSYRSCEDILQSVKPLLADRDILMTISDQMVNRGDKNYIQATVTITDGDNEITTEGWAREAENRKGMDDSQITGSTSSYARKYALNGMFCIDDTKDADDWNKHGKGKKKSKKKSSGKKKKTGREKEIAKLVNGKKERREEVINALKHERENVNGEVRSVNDLSNKTYKQLIDTLQEDMEESQNEPTTPAESDIDDYIPEEEDDIDVPF